MLSLYGELTRVYDNVILFGDSAGGGLAMGLCQSLDAADPHVSPINADLSGLPDVTIYVGTDELFLPDCRKYKDKLEAADVSVHYHEWKHMNHDFVFYPIPEGVRARREIIADLREA